MKCCSENLEQEKTEEAETETIEGRARQSSARRRDARKSIITVLSSHGAHGVTRPTTLKPNPCSARSDFYCSKAFYFFAKILFASSSVSFEPMSYQMPGTRQ